MNRVFLGTSSKLSGPLVELKLPNWAYLAYAFAFPEREGSLTVVYDVDHLASHLYAIALDIEI